MKPSEKGTPEKNKKEDFVDDGRVIVDMDVDGFSWFRGKKRTQAMDHPDLPTRKETRALIFAAYKAYLPYFLISLTVLIVVFLLGYFYLK